MLRRTKPDPCHATADKARSVPCFGGQSQIRAAGFVELVTLALEYSGLRFLGSIIPFEIIFLF